MKYMYTGNRHRRWRRICFSIWATWQCVMGLIRQAARAGSRSWDRVAPLDINGLVTYSVNTSRPGQNDRHFPDGIFQCIFLDGKFWISLKIAPKFVPKVRINNIPALVQIMAWRRGGDKPLSEPMMVRLYALLGLNELSPCLATAWPLGSATQLSQCRVWPR